MYRCLLILSALIMTATFSLSAQRTDQFVQELAVSDSLTGATITVREHGATARAVRGAERQESEKINGYRVRIFFDNSQNARAHASNMHTQFAELFPNVPVYVSYEQPYWRVTVGNCYDMEEALILWGRVKESFTGAFPIRVEIPAEEFLK